MKNDRGHFHKAAFLALSTVILLAPGPAAVAQDTSSSSLPLDWVPPTPTGLLAEPEVLRKLMNASDGSLNGDREPNDGPYAELGRMITGGGWISAGPGYRRHLLADLEDRVEGGAQLLGLD